jgi:hypothetical protein
LNMRSTHNEIYGFSLLCAFLSVWLLISPIISYVNFGEAKKVEIIRGFYSPVLIAEYYEQFWKGHEGLASLVTQWYHAQPNPPDTLKQKLEQSFAEFFREGFGLTVYFIPLILLITVAFIILFLDFPAASHWLKHWRPETKFLPSNHSVCNWTW